MRKFNIHWKPKSKKLKQGDVLYICGKTLPEAWENSIVELWKRGTEIPTQYDKPGDPPSKDCTAIIEVLDPMAEPRIHRCFPGGIEDLEIYRQEVVDGIHDHWVDPANGKWEYTYHERMCDYTVPEIITPVISTDKPIKINQNYQHIDQIQYIIDTLKDCSYSRRAQGITWKPWEDCGISDPACLQRIWCRIVDGKLQMNVHMRSNDAFKAAYMNMFGFTEWQRIIADAVGVPVGKYVHIADSYHIYSSYFSEVEGFIQNINNRTFEQRTYRSDDSTVIEITNEAKENILKSIEEEKRTGIKGNIR